MAKKRKSRTSEAVQPIVPEPNKPEPGPEPPTQTQPEPGAVSIEIKQEVVGEDVEEEVEEEVVEEEVEEEVELEEEEDRSITDEQANDDATGAGEQQSGGGAQTDSGDEPFEKLVEPFSKDQLMVLLKEAVSKYPVLMESVLKLADADPAHRKIFVHGLGWDTTAETLTDVFGKYGEIEDCKAVSDKVTGKSKGYGFILFKHRSGARKALLEPQKKIGSRLTSCQLASAGPVPAPPPTAAPPVSEYTQRKIFVSNVAADLDPQKLLEYFSKFGEIEDGPLGLDKLTGKPKGFCLFVYKNVESARKALEEPHKNFEGHTLHCQKAIDGPKTNKHFPQQQQQQQPHQQPYYGHPAKKGKYSTGSNISTSSAGHLMPPTSGPSLGYNPASMAASPAALNPAIGQALTALLASQGTGLGIGNLLGGLGAQVNPGMPHIGYGQGAGPYGAQPGMQGYPNPQIPQGVRPQQGGAPPYMGHGR